MFKHISLYMTGKRKYSNLLHMQSFTAKGGHVLEFKFIIENKGDSIIENVTIRFPLPQCLHFMNTIKAQSGDAFYSCLTHSVVWAIPYIKAAASSTLKLSTIVMRGLDCTDSVTLYGIAESYEEVSNNIVLRKYMKSNEVNIQFVNKLPDINRQV